MTRQVLSGRGVPNVRGRGRGDLIVRFVVQVPTALSAEARELVEKLIPHLGSPRSSASGGNEGDSDSDSSDDSKESGKDSVFGRILRGRKKK